MSGWIIERRTCLVITTFQRVRPLRRDNNAKLSQFFSVMRRPINIRCRRDRVQSLCVRDNGNAQEFSCLNWIVLRRISATVSCGRVLGEKRTRWNLF